MSPEAIRENQSRSDAARLRDRDPSLAATEVLAQRLWNLAWMGRPEDSPQVWPMVGVTLNVLLNEGLGGRVRRAVSAIFDVELDACQFTVQGANERGARASQIDITEPFVARLFCLRNNRTVGAGPSITTETFELSDWSAAEVNDFRETRSQQFAPLKLRDFIRRTCRSRDDVARLVTLMKDIEHRQDHPESARVDLGPRELAALANAHAMGLVSDQSSLATFGVDWAEERHAAFVASGPYPLVPNTGQGPPELSHVIGESGRIVPNPDYPGPPGAPGPTGTEPQQRNVPAWPRPDDDAIMTNVRAMITESLHQFVQARQLPNVTDQLWIVAFNSNMSMDECRELLHSACATVPHPFVVANQWIDAVADRVRVVYGQQTQRAWAESDAHVAQLNADGLARAARTQTGRLRGRLDRAEELSLISRLLDGHEIATEEMLTLWRGRNLEGTELLRLAEAVVTEAHGANFNRTTPVVAARQYRRIDIPTPEENNNASD